VAHSATLKTLAEYIALRVQERDFALFLIVIWNAAGQAAEWRGQNEREKSKSSPNPKVGLPQLSTVGSVRAQYFESLNLVATRLRFKPIGVGLFITD